MEYHLGLPGTKPVKPIQQVLAENQYASRFYEQIVRMICDFEKELDPDHEVGARLVSFGQAVQFHIQGLSYQNPSLITFYGYLESGAKVELIQHVSQISFLLMSLPKQEQNEPARRIGFQLKEKNS
ncbi:DUF6173 family protein [Halobacillus yeomjeoni]|uniref:DUF6173 family protein n=1 Tax=Halobacillus yeomjeoni TaxID=311194 RepID=UPI001CD53F5F|nr:DUF6173 family protein [Halobacillus yeomjeoni]MCA0983192.1 DUF6173 family protein [Halobacillus yeomjeoni]